MSSPSTYRTVLLICLTIASLFFFVSFDSNPKDRFSMNVNILRGSETFSGPADDDIAVKDNSAFVGNVISSASSGRLFMASKIRRFPQEQILFASPRSRDETEITLKEELRCRKWAVSTTIFPPSEALRRFLYMPEWCVVVVGDRGKPRQPFLIPTNVKNNIVFLSEGDQKSIGSEFVDNLPWESFGRKNVGYLYAVAHGAEVIWDFDDDNMLKFWMPEAAVDRRLKIDTFADLPGNLNFHAAYRTGEEEEKPEKLTFNPYNILGCPASKCWPRGFPLNHIESANDTTQRIFTRRIGRDSIEGQFAVLQSLADHEPDVDAVFRMAVGTPVNFKRPASSNEVDVLLTPRDRFTPYNAQSTLHFRSGFFALFLPVSVNGRVSDIWRAYIGQALFRLSGLRVGFMVRPLVAQERNGHDLQADFNAEIPLYTKTNALLAYLNVFVEVHRQNPLKIDALGEKLYIGLYERGFVELEDVKLYQLWIEALISAGYSSQFNGRKRSGNARTLNFSGGSGINDVRTDYAEKCDGISNSKRVIWTSDLHDGTRIDFPSLLHYLGQKTIVAGVKGGQGPYAGITFKGMSNIHIYNRISPVLKKYASHNYRPSIEDYRSHAEFYRNDSEIAETDAFMCSFPSAMCQLWMPLNKSIAYLAAHRYNIGRCIRSDWAGLNENLTELGRSGNNLIGGMSRYDYEYLRYYTGIPGVKLVSSLSGFYTRGNDFDPTREEILLVHMRHQKIPSQFAPLWNETNELNFNLTYLWKVYPRGYKLSDLVRHRAIVFLPYSVMSYKLTEFYSLAVPLLVPGPEMMRKIGGIGADRTVTTDPYCPGGTRDLPKSKSIAHPYSPNVEGKTDFESEMYWLQFADFYDWPHIQFFDSFKDLERLVSSLDFRDISNKMKQAYLIRQRQTVETWCDFLPKL